MTRFLLPASGSFWHPLVVTHNKTIRAGVKGRGGNGLLNKQQAALLLGVSVSTLDRLRSAGVIRAVSNPIRKKPLMFERAVLEPLAPADLNRVYLPTGQVVSMERLKAERRRR
jgi:hypothetical protein